MSESTISTSVIHNIASEGEPEQALTWVLNLTFLYDNVERVKILSNCSSEI